MRAEVLRVKLTSKEQTSEKFVNVRYLPTRSWLQNLVLTPAYADQLMSFTEYAATDWRAHILAWGQRG